MLFTRGAQTEPDIEVLRGRARLLVIDDHAFPHSRLFKRDGYYFERWPEIKNLTQLTDGHFDLILLDLQGVGLNESPDLQGLGILEHVKRSNPAQIVVAYSAQTQRLSANAYLELADAVIDKDSSYVTYKDLVDKFLLRRATPGYFIEVMNRVLGPDAALVPRAVPKALRVLRGGSPATLRRYLTAKLPDPEQVDRVLTIVSIGTAALQMFAS
ncbi:DNA-binding transcriptional response regulator [Phycicoccus flavus]|uniref:hypothetical protein n=1 Tax=Phycicoccus flavus TaxID=2502783 RepID=UPI000FEB63E2|nr:hypothetical protein [Phycicoccus flavus]NHA69914.1 hypothetical protein [Phycicoccus flavus]